MSIYSTELKYYVYAYMREDGTPYYIGKGTGQRAYSPRPNIAKPTSKDRILILESNLSNIGALALERRYIEWYGRKDIGTGILRNKTSGGDGTRHSPPWNKGKSGYKRKPHTKETRDLLSQKLKGRVITEEQKQKISNTLKGREITWGRKISESLTGKVVSPETRKKLSIINTGKTLSKEHKEKKSKAMKGKTWRLINGKRVYFDKKQENTLG